MVLIACTSSPSVNRAPLSQSRAYSSERTNDERPRSLVRSFARSPVRPNSLLRLAKFLLPLQNNYIRYIDYETYFGNQLRTL